MNLSRIILSYFLILSYTLGFAHTLIPHSDTLIDGQHVHDIVNTHTHSHSQSTILHSHNEINHTDHIDDGIYDYLICLFSDLEHGETEMMMVHEVPSNQISFLHLSFQPTILESDFFSIEAVFSFENKISEVTSRNTHYHSPIQWSYSLRGPPLS